MKAIDIYKSSNFNSMDCDVQTDGSKQITMTSCHYPEIYVLTIRDAPGGGFEVISDEVRQRK